MPFRYRKCHDHEHLYRDCPQNKIHTGNNQSPPTNEEGFKKVSNRRKQGRKNPTISKNLNPSTSNNFGILGSQLDDPGKYLEEPPPFFEMTSPRESKGKKKEDSIQPANNVTYA